jgi:hypothetical protein
MTRTVGLVAIGMIQQRKLFNRVSPINCVRDLTYPRCTEGLANRQKLGLSRVDVNFFVSHKHVGVENCSRRERPTTVSNSSCTLLSSFGNAAPAKSATINAETVVSEPI